MHWLILSMSVRDLIGVTLPDNKAVTFASFELRLIGFLVWLLKLYGVVVDGYSGKIHNRIELENRT